MIAAFAATEEQAEALWNLQKAKQVMREFGAGESGDGGWPDMG